MVRFNRGKMFMAPSGWSAVSTVAGGVKTHQGGAGWVRDTKSELIMLAVTYLPAEDTHNELGCARDARFVPLMRAVAIEDPDWGVRFLEYLRLDTGMRSAAIIGAAEFARARTEHNARGWTRWAVDVVCQRADEPGEFIAYWYANVGRRIPKPVKRGLAQAVWRLYTERCVTPGTLVLTRSLEWVPAGKLAIGDELVGFDEDVRSPRVGHPAKMRVSKVTSANRCFLETVKIVTDRGGTSVSADHLVVISDRAKHRKWRRASDLVPGDKLLWFGAPWGPPDRSYDAGYMAGFLDGEGYISGKSVGFGQVIGDTLEEAKAILKRLGFSFAVSQRMAKGNRQALENVIVTGGRYESMRLLGLTQPVRLARDRLWVDSDLASKGPHVVVGNCHATVLSVESLGVQENVTMGTTTKTFIADGFLAHNSVLKWDSADKPWRFADVIGLVRPTGTLADCDGTYPIKGTTRAVLYEYLRTARTAEKTSRIPEGLPMLRRHAELMAVPVEQRRAHLNAGELRAAGMTRESLAGWLQGPMDAQAYEAIIPSMGYTALVRNLRNFDRAGVSDEVAQHVISVLVDPDNVRKARVAPLQLLAAFRALDSLRWAWALEQAIGHSLSNVPQLGGHSLILVDTSTSMNHLLSDQSVVRRWDAAATFGIALAGRCEQVDLVSFSSTARYWGDPHGARTQQFLLRPGEALLTAVQRWERDGYFLGGGTATAASLRAHYVTHHNRVIILTDEQTGCDPIDLDHSMPADKPMYIINLAGEQYASVPSGPNRHAWGGLNDEMFRVIRLVEAGKAADWDAIFGPRRRWYQHVKGPYTAKQGKGAA